MFTREARAQPPALDQYSDAPLFNTKAVVRQTDVPAPTLRAWERRYGILNPQRGENDYRLYSERDIVTVAWLRERVASGMTISQAIALLRSLSPARGPRRHPIVVVPQEADLPLTPALPTAAMPSLSLDQLGDTLLRQLVGVQEQAAQRTIAQALAAYPLEDVCLSLFTPVLEALGNLWERRAIGVATEHFASSVILAQLEALFRSACGAERGCCVLVGCAPGELHEVGSLMLALFLRRLGIRVVYLGQSVETESVVALASALCAVGVVLSAALPDHAEAMVTIGERLLALEPPGPIFLYGGRAFATHPELAEQIPGQLLAMSPYDAALEIQRRCYA
jgi:methanogenic corrinoid protein MtbC1